MNNNLAKIAGIYYPKKKQLINNKDGVKYYFELMNKSIEFELKGYSSHTFLEHNNRDELILRKDFNTLIIENKKYSLLDKLLNSKKLNTEFKSNKKINKVFSLNSKTYLLSTYDKDDNHYLVLLDKNLNMISEKNIGKCSWHSQNSIDEANGVIMYAEYNVGDEPTSVSIYRSKDNGSSWQSVFSLKAPEELRHFHTLQRVKGTLGFWLATTGDTPEQSRWFLSKNDGDTWNEVTDTEHINTIYPSRNLSAHRTTAIDITNDYYYWTTDDLMGNVPSYFLCENEERIASSKLYRSKKTEPLYIEKLSNLGIHGRSMVKTDTGYLIITEAKYVSNNIQIFYADDSDMTKVYFLLSLHGSIRTGGTYSMNGNMNTGKCFLSLNNKSTFLGENYRTVTMSIDEVKKEEIIQYNIEDYIVLEEHLWFLDKIKTIEDIHFSKNSVRINLLERKETKIKQIIYMHLGDVKSDSLRPKELFDLNFYKYATLEVSVKREKNATVILYIQGYNDNLEKIQTFSFSLLENKNIIEYGAYEDVRYIKVLFRISHFTGDEIELSNLKFSLDIEKF